MSELGEEEKEEEEGSYNEYDDENFFEEDEGEDSDDETLRTKCLPLDAIMPDFESGEPTDGFEYIRRVKYEASRIPNVIVSDVNPRDYDAQRTPETLKRHGFITKGNGSLVNRSRLRILEHAKANSKWTKLFLSSFSNVRVSMQRALDAAEEENIAQKTRSIGSRKYIASERFETAPLLSDMVAIDDITVNTLFRKYCYAFTDKDEEKKYEKKEKIKHVWFYALAARVSMPLDGETQAAVRRASRVFAKLLSKVTDKEKKDENRVAALNIALTIAWKYFGQPPFDDDDDNDDEE